MPDCFVAEAVTKQFSRSRNHFPLGVQTSGNVGSLTICSNEAPHRSGQWEPVMQNVVAINAAARQGIIAAQATSDEILLGSIADGARTAMHLLSSLHHRRV